MWTKQAFFFFFFFGLHDLVRLYRLRGDLLAFADMQDGERGGATDHGVGVRLLQPWPLRASSARSPSRHRGVLQRTPQGENRNFILKFFEFLFEDFMSPCLASIPEFQETFAVSGYLRSSWTPSVLLYILFRDPRHHCISQCKLYKTERNARA